MDERRAVAWMGHWDEAAGSDEWDKAVWRKSSYSQNTNCVEVAPFADHVLIRNSRAQRGPTLVFTLAEWDAFVNGVSDGQFNFP